MTLTWLKALGALLLIEFQHCLGLFLVLFFWLVFVWWWAGLVWFGFVAVWGVTFYWLRLGVRVLCSALVLSLFERDMISLCDIPFTPLPPASFSFYKTSVRKVATGKNKWKIHAGFIPVCLSKGPTCTTCSHSSMLEDMHVLLPLGSVFLGFITNYFFHVVGILKQQSFIWKWLEKPAGMSIYSGSSPLMSRHTQEEV